MEVDPKLNRAYYHYIHFSILTKRRPSFLGLEMNAPNRTWVNGCPFSHFSSFWVDNSIDYNNHSIVVIKPGDGTAHFVGGTSYDNYTSLFNVICYQVPKFFRFYVNLPHVYSCLLNQDLAKRGCYPFKKTTNQSKLFFHFIIH